MTSYLLPSSDSRITYSQGWNKVGSNGTQTYSTSQRGAFLTFSFNGTFIAVFGRGSANYTIDCGTSQSRSSPSSSTPGSSALYNSEPLADEEHQLLIVNAGDSFTLDFMTLTADSSATNSGELSSPDKFTSCVPQAVSQSSRQHPPVGAIVGIVIGALVLISVLFAVGMYYWRRKQRCLAENTKELDILESDPEIKEKDKLEGSVSRNFSFRFPRRHLPGSTPAASNTLTESSAMFTSVILLSPFPSTTAPSSSAPSNSQRQDTSARSQSPSTSSRNLVVRNTS